jgi:hypothetical protein
MSALTYLPSGADQLAPWSYMLVKTKHSANDACRVGTAGTNDDRPQTPILSAAPVTMSISVLCFCCLKMLESHSLLLRIQHFRCLS